MNEIDTCFVFSWFTKLNWSWIGRSPSLLVKYIGADIHVTIYWQFYVILSYPIVGTTGAMLALVTLCIMVDTMCRHAYHHRGWGRAGEAQAVVRQQQPPPPSPLAGAASTPNVCPSSVLHPTPPHKHHRWYSGDIMSLRSFYPVLIFCSAISISESIKCVFSPPSHNNWKNWSPLFLLHISIVYCNWG